MMIATRRLLERSLYVVLAGLSLMLLIANPLAATPTVTFNLTSPGSGANLAGVYTSPYYGNINGGSTIPVICDDFADESYVPETWTAYVTSGSSISGLTPGTTGDQLNWLNTSGSTITVNGQTLDQAQAYTVAAVLAVDIMQSTGTAQEDYSYALWGLFDPYGNGVSGDPGAFGQLAGYTSDLNNATMDLYNAVSYAFNSVNAAQVQTDVNAITIYSYDASAGIPTGACGGPCPKPQEFITVNMAEPPAPALLGMDLLGLAGLMLIARHRGWLAR
jgi:hypothetical protein